ncbi:MAG: hypothetical protein RL394_868, partial [Bacteroidota bacterium]
MTNAKQHQPAALFTVTALFLYPV